MPDSGRPVPPWRKTRGSSSSGPDRGSVPASGRPGVWGSEEDASQPGDKGRKDKEATPLGNLSEDDRAWAEQEKDEQWHTMKDPEKSALGGGGPWEDEEIPLPPRGPAKGTLAKQKCKHPLYTSRISMRLYFK